MRQVTRAGVAVLVGLSIAAIAAPAGGVVVFEREWGSLGAADGQFNRPLAVTTDAGGNVWVADATVIGGGNNRIQKFGPSGAFLSKFGATGSGNGQLRGPQGLVVSGNEVVVADTFNHRIQRFSAFDGSFIAAAGSQGSGANQYRRPGAITRFGTDYYVADSGNNRIKFITSALGNILMFGSAGTGNGQFDNPLGLAMGPEYLYVADSGNNRIQVFTTLGEFVGKFGTKGATLGNFKAPEDVAVRDGFLYVADTGNNRIQQFSLAPDPAHPSFFAAWGSTGSGPGDFRSPLALATGAAGRVYVADYNNARIQEFAPGGTITVRKAATPQMPQDFGFTSPRLGSFLLDDDPSSPRPSSVMFKDLAPGSYSITEDETAGWQLSNLVCTPMQAVDLGQRRVDINLGPSGNVDCTFTNRPHHRIVIEKQVAPAVAQQFPFTSPQLGSFTLNPVAGTPAAAFEVSTGTYTVQEAAVPGWSLTDLTCDPPQTVDLLNRTVDITVGPSDTTITCTFANTEGSSITIVKDAQPQQAEDFSFTTTGTGLSPFVLDGDPGSGVPDRMTFSSLAPGAYSVTEAISRGWDLTGLACTPSQTTDLGQRRVDINLTAGQNVTCTFGNRRRQPDAAINKPGVDYIGFGVINTTGDQQTRRQAVGRGDVGVFRAQIRNEGVLDTFTVQGPEGESGFAVRYFRGDDEITDAVVAGTYEFEDVPPGSSTPPVVIKVKVKAGATVGAVEHMLLTTSSPGPPARQDAVRAIVTATR